VVEAGVHRLESYLRHRLEKVEEPEGKIDAWIRGVLGQASQETVARQTRGAMGNLRQLPPEGGQKVSAPATPDPVVEAPYAAGRAAPERDAAAISVVSFGRLEDFLMMPTPTDDDVDQVVAFCLAAIRR